MIVLLIELMPRKMKQAKKSATCRARGRLRVCTLSGKIDTENILTTMPAAAKTRTRRQESRDEKGGGTTDRKKSKSLKQDVDVHAAMQTEEDFPRGGTGAYIAPVELKRIREVGCVYVLMTVLGIHAFFRGGRLNFVGDRIRNFERSG